MENILLIINTMKCKKRETVIHLLEVENDYRKFSG